MIDINKIFSLVSSQNKQTKISYLISEILILQDKLSNFDNQSFYFKRAIEQNNLRLKDFLNSYNEIKEEFNNLSLENLLNEKKTIEIQLIDAKKKARGLIPNIYLQMVKNKLTTIEDYIKMKSEFSELKNIEDYTNEELYTFFEA